MAKRMISSEYINRVNANLVRLRFVVGPDIQCKFLPDGTRITTDKVTGLTRIDQP